MISKEILLGNGFEFRSCDEDSTYPGLVNLSPEGEYTKRIGSYKFITIGYSELYKWNFEVINLESHIRFTGDCQDAISIDSLQKMLDLAGIELKLNRGENENDWKSFK
jgi:hypothetical protein